MGAIDTNRWYAKLLGWTPADFNATAFDDQLVGAIKDAQARFGASVDGVCGPKTYGALLADRQTKLTATQGSPDRLRDAGTITMLEAKCAWLRNIIDLPPVGTPDYQRCEAEIDRIVASRDGLGWSWESPYKGNHQIEWCGAFAAFAWRAAGMSLEARKSYFSSTYRLDRWARYARWTDEVPDPRPAHGPYRQIIELDEHSGPLDAHFSDDDPPRAGDILMVGGVNTAYGKHVTIVESYDSTTGVFTTLEGNATGPGPSGGTRHGVIRNHRPVGLPRGATPTTYHARRLIRPSVQDLTG
jgi:hypothetical protein